MTLDPPATDVPAQEMTALVRDFDWAATPLGPRADWPVGLRIMTEMLLSHPLAMIVLWGSELTQIYNDPYRVIMAGKHPAGLGQPTRECWPEVWPFNAPIYEGVTAGGKTFKFLDQPLTIQRHGQDEEAFFTLTYSPVCDDHGEVGGVLVTVIETTRRVRAERAAELHRQEVERRNAALEVFATLTRHLALDTDALTLIRHVQDAVLPLLDAGFSQYYEPEDGRWRVRSQVGHVKTPAAQVALDAGLPFELVSPLLVPWQTGQAHYLTAYDPATDGLPQSEDAPFTIVTLPVMVHSQVRGVLAFMIVGTRAWSPADRATLETVQRSLSLALERAEQTRQAEQQRTYLAQRTAALQEANEELEAFSYSVSHDLRTPVRHIKGFSDLLRKSLGPGLGLKDRHYLGVIDEASGRMNVLIDAMLDLSRTARQPLRMEPVDLEALVLQLQQELEADTQGRAVHWAVSPLPLVRGDYDTLRQVLSNLLDNALKYTQSREQAVIEVWAEERAGVWAVCVRDNGVGFDPRYAGKLFGVFQRLHLERDFEGTGIGLATVRRIIARHGGTVSGQGVLGEGATFSFTLPR